MVWPYEAPERCHGARTGEIGVAPFAGDRGLDRDRVGYTSGGRQTDAVTG
jgi:hypothetical protein